MIDDEIIDNYITGLYIGIGCLEPQVGGDFILGDIPDLDLDSHTVRLYIF